MENPNMQTEATLLQEGAKSYPDALLALAEFRRRVQDRFTEVVRESLKGQAASMDLALSKEMVRPYAEPDFLSSSSFDGTNATLGVQIQLKDRGIWLYYYLEWDQERGSDERSLGINVVLYFAKTEPAQEVWRAIKAKCPGDWEFTDGRSIYLYREVSTEKIGSLDMDLKDAIKQWSQGWQEVGGLSRIFNSKGSL